MTNTELLQQLKACVITQTNSNGESQDTVDPVTAIKLIIQLLENLTAKNN